MKTLVIDIETRPNLAYVWSIWDENVGLNQLVESVEMMCFACKWMDSAKVSFFSGMKNGRSQMVEAAWRLVNEADAVLHYNGRSFDMKHLNREFLEAGMPPPSPVQQIDLLTVVKRQFKFPSNKLEYVASHLGIGSKLKHEGFDMWKRCLAGDVEAWRLMEQYNKEDVLLTERLYRRIRPWVHNHPSHATYDGDSDVCPQCGSPELVRRGFYYTPQATYQRFCCADCGKWSRSTRSGSRVTIKGVE